MKRIVANKKLDLTRPPWGDVSYLAKDLLIRMLEKDWRTRISAEELFNHEWFMVASPTSNDNT
jgi:serine/threonine protein kinase